MYYDEHNPPHFHASYAGDEAEVGIEPIAVLVGKLPSRATSLVIEWAAIHQQQLMRNWDRARHDQPIERIPPLD
jgi:hypothetical protein